MRDRAHDDAMAEAYREDPAFARSRVLQCQDHEKCAADDQSCEQYVPPGRRVRHTEGPDHVAESGDDDDRAEIERPSPDSVASKSVHAERDQQREQDPDPDPDILLAEVADHRCRINNRTEARQAVDAGNQKQERGSDRPQDNALQWGPRAQRLGGEQGANDSLVESDIAAHLRGALADRVVLLESVLGRKH